MSYLDTDSPSPPSDVDLPWCELRLYGKSIRYLRVGTGKPLILVTARSRRDALWPSVMKGLSEKHRIYIPEVPEQGSEFNAWLRSFMEGVGAESISLVAAGEWCIPALEFALADADRIDRLLLLPAGESEETGQRATLHGENGNGTLPILVLRREHPDGKAHEIVGQFFEQQR